MRRNPVNFSIFATMKLKRLINCFLFLLLVTGCKESKELLDTLKRAEAVMEATPDSAYTLLQNLDTEKLKTREGRARYALLYTQAQDKCYIDETNDSLITTAVNYYRHYGEVRNRFLSIYYKGRVYSNARDYLKAMLAYAEAETLIPEVKDNYYCGLLYSQLGNIYRTYYDFPKSLEAYQKAEKFYRKAKKDFHWQFAMTDQSGVYRNMDEYTKSDSLLQTILEEAKRMKNHTLIDYVSGNLLMQYVEQEKMYEARCLYDSLKIKYGLENKTSNFMASVVRIHLLEGEIQEAEQMLQKAWVKAKTENDSIVCHLVASQVYKAMGVSDRALQEQEKGVLMQNNLVEEKLEQPILTMQRDYLAQKLEYAAYKQKMNRLVYVLSFTLILISLVATGYWVQKKIRQNYRRKLHYRLQQQETENQRKLERLWEEAMQREHTIRLCLEDLNQEMRQKDEISSQNISNLQKEVCKQDETLHQYKKQLEELTAFADKDNQRQKELCLSLCHTYFRTLDKMFITYYYNEYANDKSRYAAMNDVLMKYAEKYTKGKKGYALLEKTVNAYMNDVMTYLRTEIKLSDEEYYQQICFQFAGFSGTTIAHLMGSTANAIYKRKDRIIEKIKKERPLHSTMFLDLLSK